MTTRNGVIGLVIGVIIGYLIGVYTNYVFWFGFSGDNPSDIFSVISPSPIPTLLCAIIGFGIGYLLKKK